MPDTIERFFEVDEISKELPSGVPTIFQPTTSSWIFVQWYHSVNLKHVCSSSKICSAWLTSLLRITRNTDLLVITGQSFCSTGRVPCCRFSEKECSATASSHWTVVYWSRFFDIRQLRPGRQPVTRSSIVQNIGWDVVDIWWFTILQPPYCFLHFFFKYWCLSGFSVFYLVFFLRISPSVLSL